MKSSHCAGCDNYCGKRCRFCPLEPEPVDVTSWNTDYRPEIAYEQED